MSKEPKCIAYITEMFPALTQTFVYRELFAVRERGVPIHPFSIWRPEPDSLSAEAISLRDETFYIFPRRWLSVLFLQFRNDSHAWNADGLSLGSNGGPHDQRIGLNNADRLAFATGNRVDRPHQFIFDRHAVGHEGDHDSFATT